jgi:hypothetical protein
VEVLLSRRDWIVLILLLSLCSVWSLSPFVSDWLPAGNDSVWVVGHVAQMELALSEGQIPPRVAPLAVDGWRYPAFQFYSPLPYTLFGLMAHAIPGHNPWVAVQIILFLALLGGGIGMFLLAREIGCSSPAAAIASCAYITAPYWLVNMHARAAMAEAFAQGILPVAAYFLWRATRVPSLHRIAKAAIAVAILFLSHLITGTYFLIAFSITLAVESIFAHRPWKRLAVVPLAAIGAALLAAYYFLPMLHTKELLMSGKIGDPTGWSFLTTFFRLLSPTSLAPSLDGGGSEPNMNPAIGIPILAGILLLVIRLIQSPEEEVRTIRPVAVGLLAVIPLFFLFTWSPVDVWSWVPSIFYVVQFPYRLLAQIQWMGVLCLALGLTPALRLVNPANPLPVIVGAVFCVLASNSYITAIAKKTSVAEHVLNPELGYGGDLYTRDVKAPGTDMPFIGSKLVSDTSQACHTMGSTVQCTLNMGSAGVAQIPVLYYPEFLDVRVNGSSHVFGRLRARDKRGVERDLVALELGAGQSIVTADFIGSRLGNWISLLSIGLFAAAFAIPRIRRQRGPVEVSSIASSAGSRTPPRRKKI